MSYLAIGTGATAATAVFLFFSPLFLVLDVTTVKTGLPVFCIKMTEGEEFVLSFIHSVNRRPVFDTFRVKGDHLIVVKSRFDSFGAGMPGSSEEGGQLRVSGDGWLEWRLDRLVSEVTFFSGWVADHSLHIRGRSFPLADRVGPGTLLCLRIERASYYKLWKEGCTR